MSESPSTTSKPESAAGRHLREILARRLVFLDGAMGTMIQQHKPTEEDYRGDQFKDAKKDLKGNNDLLSITRPHIIEEIHNAFLEAGSDIIETNTFSGTTVAQGDYAFPNTEEVTRMINLESAKLARKCADAFTEKEPDKPRFVAGAVGPTNRTASISPDVNDPSKRNVTFNELVDSYHGQIVALVEGGVDILLIETIFDTLNAKAAVFAAEKFFDGHHEHLPVMLSGTITDASGRTLSGQTPEAFWNSLRHAEPLSVGFNCALGADLMRPYLQELSRIAGCYVSCYPNAGLPNPLAPTGYDELPEDTAKALQGFVEEGLVNVIGGCCGTTPAHIKAVYEANKDLEPRKIPSLEPGLRLSGLEAMNLATA